jgi:AmmeMemoRadiSam system protein A
MLTVDEQRHLLRLARAAFEAHVRGVVSREDTDAAITVRRGAFVTILQEGELRGCLGRISTDLPLPGLIRHLAREVADSDPRFDPVRVDELARISLEISVLTEEREIADVSEIEVGRHGLIVQQGSRRGLLLPQVPTEYGWTVDIFVSHTCLKAGLAADAWRRGARLFVFEAQVFGEEERG